MVVSPVPDVGARAAPVPAASVAKRLAPRLFRNDAAKSRLCFSVRPKNEAEETANAPRGFLLL